MNWEQIGVLAWLLLRLDPFCRLVVDFGVHSGWGGTRILFAIVGGYIAVWAVLGVSCVLCDKAFRLK